MVEHVIGNDGVESPILFSGTNARNPPFVAGFSHWYRRQERTFGGKESPESTSSSEFLRDGGDVVSRQAKDNRSAAPFLKKHLIAGGFCFVGVASRKVR